MSSHQFLKTHIGSCHLASISIQNFLIPNLQLMLLEESLKVLFKTLTLKPVPLKPGVQHLQLFQTLKTVRSLQVASRAELFSKVQHEVFVGWRNF